MVKTKRNFARGRPESSGFSLVFLIYSRKSRFIQGILLSRSCFLITRQRIFVISKTCGNFQRRAARLFRHLTGLVYTATQTQLRQVKPRHLLDWTALSTLDLIDHDLLRPGCHKRSNTFFSFDIVANARFRVPIIVLHISYAIMVDRFHRA